MSQIVYGMGVLVMLAVMQVQLSTQNDAMNRLPSYPSPTGDCPTNKEDKQKLNKNQTYGPYELNCEEAILNRKGEWHGKNWLFQTRTRTFPKSFLMNLHTKDTTLAPHIIQMGCFECPIFHALIQELIKLPPKDVFLIDIGSNIGQYSLGAAANGYDAYAFEPLQQNWAQICYSMYSNPGFEDRIKVFHTALSSDGPSKIQFFLRWKDNPSAAAIVKSDNTQQQQNNDIEGEEGKEWAWAIPMELVEKSLPKTSPQQRRKAIVKVDVEGMSLCRFSLLDMF